MFNVSTPVARNAKHWTLVTKYEASELSLAFNVCRFKDLPYCVITTVER